VSLEQDHEPESTDLEALWPYLSRTKHTGFHQALMAGIKALHAFEKDLDAQTWSALSSRVQQAYKQSGWFDSVLERARIQLALWDSYFTVPQPVCWSTRVLPVLHTDDFLDQPWVHPQGGQAAAEIAQAWGVEVSGLDDLLNALDLGFARYAALGAVATKIGVAYRRSLSFDPASEAEARAAFSDLRNGPNEKARITLGNYMIRHILRRSAESGLTIQVHTGMNNGQLELARPTRLVNLFQEFPKVNFVLFHGGYPYTDEAGLLAKAFPNVYVDLCWMPQISPAMSVDVLERWLELVPHTKIMWGGDVWSAEECYGAVLAFKDVLARALSRRMAAGSLTLTEALELASRIMHLNATELFGLEDRLNACE
jgi:predicted TIM-barrel fold metal-dependent hydrolase